MDFVRALFSTRSVRSIAVPMVALFLLCVSAPLSAAEGNVARDLANPFSSLWNVVNQINFNKLKGGEFSNSHTQFNWNLQPVMPMPLNEQFNLVNRPVTVIPSPFAKKE